MTPFLRTILSRPYPLQCKADMVACDYLRKMGQLERPELMAALEVEYPEVAAAIRSAYPHHVS